MSFREGGDGGYEFRKGIAIYPASAGDISTPDALCIKRIVNPSVMASYVLIWNKERQLSHVAKEFLGYVRKTEEK